MFLRKQLGFSLIELLIVLTLINVLWLISANHYHKKLNHIAFEQWYQQFELDIIELQKHTMVTNITYHIQFYPSSNRYELRQGPFGEGLVRREWPEEWKITMLTLQNQIRFTRTGTIRSPGTMQVKTNTAIYHIYFPFGKARCYYIEI
ncbi:prepilin-type N-terminal cleavage/methylation domain-containing protein [Amphibacillus jilinensis]|uniref:prepilin-type N-terminal cleavage/methylation domain-containing protein n=1 Tax=Amphibacillus jilinensis TaxID=1216008 RepID=UPI0002F7FD47|nr:prepilin-type N-terminal cleavage/methylation domain-containing protein [Amphibacillus jilinensis]